MRFTIVRERLLTPLQQVIGAVERRQTMPSLNNLLLEAEDGRLSITATDLEIELRAETEAVELEQGGQTTIPARKLLDICRSLPADSIIELATEGERVVLKASATRSRFMLASLPSEDFPVLPELGEHVALSLRQGDLRRLLEQTAFAMAQQDVRYFLNGLLVEAEDDHIRAVATDGHRLALCEVERNPFDSGDPVVGRQILIPRKGVTELLRVLEEGVELVRLQLAASQMRLQLADLRFTSKLIDGRFPDYRGVIPGENPHRLVVGREAMRQALNRMAILASDRFRGVRMVIAPGRLSLQAHNPEREEAEEEIPGAEYDGDALEVAFNISYMLDIVNHMEADQVVYRLRDDQSSCLVSGPGDDKTMHVIMPLKL